MSDSCDSSEQKRLAAVFEVRAKLLADALDRASTAFIAVGVIGPVIGDVYGPGGSAGFSDGCSRVWK